MPQRKGKAVASRQSAQARGRGRRRRSVDPLAYQRGAKQRLRRFRQATGLAVAVTGFALLLWGVPGEASVSGGLAQNAAAVQDTLPRDTAAGAVTGVADTAAAEVSRAVGEAKGTLRDLVVGFAGLLPKIFFAIGVLLVGWLITRLLRPLLRRALASWVRAEAASISVSVLIWILAAAVALSIIAGDVRAIVGSVGLLGLALSWALQTPIESFTAYLLNSFKGYYRVGDRIEVGEVFGDVYRIDLLTTTVWEAGGPDKPVQGAQSTGALTTFPNSEVLRGNIINYTRDFPYVWDEVVVGVANESDLRHAMRVTADTARAVIGPMMELPIQSYRSMLASAGLAFDVATEPQVYLAPTDAWMNITVRYLVPARERRKWASALQLELSERLSEKAQQGRVIGAYPVTRVELHDARADGGGSERASP